MPESRNIQLNAIFQALSDNTRRAMLQQLAQGESSIGELSAPFKMSFAGASKHIKVLEQAGLITRNVQGRTHICRLEPAALAEAHHWLRYYEKLWNKRLDLLEKALQNDPPPDEPHTLRRNT